MSLVFKNRPRVYEDIAEAVEYLLDINPNLAQQFLDELENTKQRILTTPRGFQIKYKQKVRTILIKPFDYHLYYILDKNEIVILAILHAKSGKEKINKI